MTTLLHPITNQPCEFVAVMRGHVSLRLTCTVTPAIQWFSLAAIEAANPVGLSTSLDTLEALCGHEPRVLDYIAQAKQGIEGRPIGTVNNSKKQVNSQGEVGHKTSGSAASLTRNTVATTFNRLRTEAYDIDRETGEIRGVKDERIRQLYEDVLEKRIAPNAAAIEAGFRPRGVKVNLDNMESCARTLVQRLTPDQLDELIAQLVDYRGR